MKILNFPPVRQNYSYDCGVAAVQSVLFYYGVDVQYPSLKKMLKSNVTGTPIANIKRIFKKYGFRVIKKEMTIKEIKQYINKEIPVILPLQAWSEDKKIDWEKDWKDGHYVVAIGYDEKKIYFQDPAAIFKTYLTYEELLKRWHDKDKKRKYFCYGLAIIGGRRGEIFKKIIHMD